MWVSTGSGYLAGMQERPVPYRSLAAAIAMVVLTALGLLLVYEVRRVLVWIIVALFFAVALYPVANFLERRYPRAPRSVATLLVFLAVFVVLAGLAAVFAVPLAREATSLAGQLPQLIADARAGRGPVGGLLDRTNALEWVQQNQARISEYGRSLATPALGIAKAAATSIAGVVTIFVLAYLMVLEAPRSSTASSPCSTSGARNGSAGSATTAPRPSPGTSPATC